MSMAAGDSKGAPSGRQGETVPPGEQQRERKAKAKSRLWWWKGQEIC